MNKTSIIFREISFTTESQKLVLFCFPYGGGDWSAYYFLSKLGEYGIKVIGISLPGRANRISEDYIISSDDLVADIISMINKTDLPFAFFGHSFGAGLAFDVANKLHEQGKILPHVMILSGRMPPHCGYIDILSLENDFFIDQYVRDSSNIDKNDCSDIINEFIAYQSRIIKADLELNSQLTYNFNNKLPIKIHILNGDEDQFIVYDRVNEWSFYSSINVSYNFYKGNHFYYKNHKELILLNFKNFLSI